MSVNAKDVMKLRKATGAGMMDCKKALGEAENDFDRAIEIIREKGKALASKRADREASEGAVVAASTEDGSFGAMIALNCETDFVAKNDGFVALATKILTIAVDNRITDLDALKAADFEGKSVAEVVVEQTGVIGEKLDLSYLGTATAECVVPYTHAGNKLATLIGFSGAVETQVGRDVAMQAAAMAPIAIDKAQVAQETIDAELKIAMEKFRLEGKPEAMLEKIAQGSLAKWFKENTLLNQAFIKDGKNTVKGYLATEAKGVEVNAMVRHTLNA